MKFRRKKLLAIILAIAICMSNMMGTSVSRAAAESAAEETIYAEDADVIKEEDYDDISFDYAFKVQSEWENHYTAEMTLKNTGKDEIGNWETAFVYDGEIENIWHAKIVSHYDNVYVVKNVGWNQNINAGGQVTFGFTAKFDGHKPEEPCSVDMQRVSEQVFDNCNIEFKQFTKYENKIQGQVEITNTSENYIEDWSFDFECNFKIVDIWNAKVYEENFGSDEEDHPTDAHYSLTNMGYNQSIEPGQTINFGFIGELLEDDDAKFENETLYQLTVYPYEEDGELNEDDCIWEGDVDDDVPMSVVEDEVFDEDDYDRVEEDELAKEVDTEEAVQLFANSRSVSTAALSKTSGKEEGDKISYYVYGLPHKRQVQTWCQFVYKNKNNKNVKVIFVAQNDNAGHSVISLCKKEKDEVYKYDSEIQIRKSGHTQSLYCQGMSDGKFYLYTNCHGVKYKDKNGKITVWGTRFARVTFDTTKKGKNKKDKNAKNIVDMDTDKSLMKLRYTVKGDRLKYFKAVAYSRKEKESFAGPSNRKGVAKLKRCDFAISPNNKYMIIWKKSDDNKVEYSLYDWEKLEKAYKNTSGKYISFNSEEVRKMCLYTCKEDREEVAKRSFQGIALDNSKNVIITSGNDKKENEKPGSEQYIALLYKKWTNENQYGKTKKIKLETPKYDEDDWMRNLVKEEVGTTSKVPWLEIEGAQVVGDRVLFSVGIVSNELFGDNPKDSWRTRSFIFSRKLNKILR